MKIIALIGLTNPCSINAGHTSCILAGVLKWAVTVTLATQKTLLYFREIKHLARYISD
jgi:hypothetical protein